MVDATAFQDFLTKLSTDPSARNSYRDNPVAVMEAEGLSDSQVVAVLSSDPKKIQAELGGEVTEAAIRVTVSIIVQVTVTF
jgi:hypothetical protein